MKNFLMILSALFQILTNADWRKVDWDFVRTELFAMNSMVVLTPTKERCDTKYLSLWLRPQSWIYFTPELEAEFFHFQIGLISKLKFDELKINSMAIAVEGLDIEVFKELDFSDTVDEATTGKDHNYVAWCILSHRIFVSDLIEAYKEKHGKTLTTEKMFKEFRRAKKVWVNVKFEYTVDGERYSQGARFSFTPKNKRTFRIIDWASSI